MKKSLLSATIALSLMCSVGYAQTKKINPCATYEAQQTYIKTIPGYKAQLDLANAKNAQEFQAYTVRLNAERSLQRSTAANPASYTYTIPVVFHILHTNGPENISDATCIAALAQVNKDYAKQGSDIASIDPLYEPLYVNSHMNFVLAKKDPYGNCTNGIVHHYDENTQWKQSDLYNYQYSTVGTYNWSSSKYLNIYIVANIIDEGTTQGIIVGYTHLPGTAPNVGSDAIVYRYDFLGGLNARSLSHEIGHWFGLSHTFGGSNNAGSVCGNDDIYDTPATSGFFSTCPPYLSLNDSCDPGHRPNINNIMDYSGCPMMFTQGQTDKMRFSAESSTANRNYLVDTTNLLFTGILARTFTITVNPVTQRNDTAFTYFSAPASVCAPVADFYATKAKVCQGQSVVYNSTSFNNATGLSYSWQFEGGSPATSTSATPSVTYAVPGNYSTTLTVTNSAGTSTKVRNPFLSTSWHVDQASYPAMEGFENSSSLPAGWSVINEKYGSLTWRLANYGSQGSSRCMILPYANFEGTTFSQYGSVDILETNQYNFTNTSAITVSYDYSYARMPSTAGDIFKFDYSLDCGGTWINIGTAPTSTVMSSTSGGTVTAPYIPFSQSKWVTKTFPALTLGALVNKSDVKFRFWFQSAGSFSTQNLYLDNFNITGTVGLEQLENTIGLSIYPNPTSGSSILEFTSPVNAKTEVTVFDVMGRIVEQNTSDVLAGSLTKYNVNKNNVLKAGIYFVSLSLNNQKITKKLIID